jgi:hypothetical protein
METNCVEINVLLMTIENDQEKLELIKSKRDECVDYDLGWHSFITIFSLDIYIHQLIVFSCGNELVSAKSNIDSCTDLLDFYMFYLKSDNSKTFLLNDLIKRYNLSFNCHNISLLVSRITNEDKKMEFINIHKSRIIDHDTSNGICKDLHSSFSPKAVTEESSINPKKRKLKVIPEIPQHLKTFLFEILEDGTVISDDLNVKASSVSFRNITLYDFTEKSVSCRIGNFRMILSKGKYLVHENKIFDCHNRIVPAMMMIAFTSQNDLMAEDLIYKIGIHLQKHEKPCYICNEREAVTMVVPCRHARFCVRCGMCCKNCPICGEPVFGSIRFF